MVTAPSETDERPRPLIRPSGTFSRKGRREPACGRRAARNVSLSHLLPIIAGLDPTTQRRFPEG
jgi:hypothetical protein